MCIRDRRYQAEAGAAAHGGVDARRVPTALFCCAFQSNCLDAFWRAALSVFTIGVSEETGANGAIPRRMASPSQSHHIKVIVKML